MDKSYYVLEIRDPDFDAERYEISEEEVHLGRSQGKADIVVPDLKASGRHCTLTFDGSIVTVTDLESTNGTWFEDARITAKHLSPGQVFKIGDSEIRLVSVHEAHQGDEEVLEATRAMSAAEMADFMDFIESDNTPKKSDDSAGSSVQTDEDESLEPESSDSVNREVMTDGNLGPMNEEDESASEGFLPETVAESNVTTAFDRSSTPVGDSDIGSRMETRPADSHAADTPQVPIPQRPVFVRSFFIAGFTLIALSLLTVGATFIPGDELVLPTAEGIGADRVALAALSWRSVAGETVLAPYVSDVLYESLQSHYEKTAELQKVVATESLPPRLRKQSFEEMMNYADYASSSAKLWFESWEKVQIGLWIASAIALFAGIFLVMGWQKTGVILAVSSILGPLVMGQPVPILSFAIAAVFSLIGLMLLAILLIIRKSSS